MRGGVFRFFPPSLWYTIFGGTKDYTYLWQLFTHNLEHGHPFPTGLPTLAHLSVNLLIIATCGVLSERILGKRRFWVLGPGSGFYVATGQAVDGEVHASMTSSRNGGMNVTFDKDQFFGYSVQLRQLSEEDGGGWLASVPELRGCLADGKTPDEAYAELKEVLEFWLQVAREEGKAIPEPAMYQETQYSGRTVIRMPKHLHRILSEQAELEGVSLNQYMVSLLSFNAGRYEQSAGKEPSIQDRQTR